MRALRGAAPDLADALEVGTPTLLRSPALNRRLASLLTSLRDVRRGPAGPARHPPPDRRRCARSNPTLQYLAPAQTACNYVALWFRNVSSLLSEGDANGTWQRFIIIATPQGPNNEGGPSSAPANGPTRREPPAHQPVPEHGARPASRSECEAGNETYLAGKTVIGNVAAARSRPTTEGTP